MPLPPPAPRADAGADRTGLVGAEVQQVVRAVTIAPLPRAPAIVEGVINLRGALIPVLDIRARFDLPAKKLASLRVRSDDSPNVLRRVPQTVIRRSGTVSAMASRTAPMVHSPMCG